MYEVQLPVFQGPLELLLHLIEKKQLDITTLSLVEVTEQYMENLRLAEQIDMDSLADFLVIAAKLLYIKSVTLLPRAPSGQAEEEEDPGKELARVLEEYRKFKTAAEQLKVRYESGNLAYPRLSPLPRPEAIPAPLELTLHQLVAAIDKVLQRVSVEELPVVERRTVTITDRIEVLRKRLSFGSTVSFSSFVADCTSRESVIVSFLSMLELIKVREVEVRQEVLFGDILICSAAITPDYLAGV